MMLYGIPITGEIYDVSNPPRNADGEEMTQEEWLIENEKQAMGLEEANWHKFYRAINDDNMEHAMNAFQNQGFTTYEQIHDANVQWYIRATELGMTTEQIEEFVPGAELYKDEASERSNLEDDGFSKGVESITAANEQELNQ